MWSEVEDGETEDKEEVVMGSARMGYQLLRWVEEQLALWGWPVGFLASGAAVLRLVWDYTAATGESAWFGASSSSTGWGGGGSGGHFWV